jgi:hypothetical protein
MKFLHFNRFIDKIYESCYSKLVNIINFIVSHETKITRDCSCDFIYELNDSQGYENQRNILEGQEIWKMII